MTDFPQEYRDGYVIFCGHRVLVDPRALIPRIETEELVKYALAILEEKFHINSVVDIGTGSGIIPVSIAHKIQRKIDLIATDMSQDALDLARENFMGIKNPLVGAPHLLKGDLLVPVGKYFGKDPPSSILITTNLPYVLAREVVGDLTYEPRMAFLGGEKTGFELYERFFQQLSAWKYRPTTCHIVIEFGLWQRDIAETVLSQYDWEYTFFADLRDIERFCHIIIEDH